MQRNDNATKINSRDVVLYRIDQGEDGGMGRSMMHTMVGC